MPRGTRTNAPDDGYRPWKGREGPWLTTDDMKLEAAKRDGAFLSPHYRYAPALLRWRCKSGHLFERIGTEVRGGQWCTVCSPRQPRLTIADMRKIARERGGDCLSEKYNARPKKLEWRCAKGHAWRAAGVTVRQGSWCPHCAGRARKTIDDVRRIARKRGGDCLSKEYRPAPARLLFVCARGHRWRTAATLVCWKGAWCALCGANRLRIEDLQALAVSRGGECLSKVYRAGQSLRWRCAVGHEWRADPVVVKFGTWCPRCHGMHKTIRDMQELARTRGGTCMSATYAGAFTKLRWQCEKRHIWDATPTSVGAGRWCPRCGGKASYTIDQIREIASLRGGRCLERSVTGVRTPMRWRCNAGHEWKAPIMYIVAGQWCPLCNTPEARRRHAVTAALHHGGTCDVEAYRTIDSVLTWTCRRGHQWPMTARDVFKGDWCARCPSRPARWEKRPATR